MAYNYITLIVHFCYNHYLYIKLTDQAIIDKFSDAVDSLYNGLVRIATITRKVTFQVNWD